MKHLDLFTGYGGFTLALQNYNNRKIETGEAQQYEYPSSARDNELPRQINDEASETIGFSEIDKFASQVIAYHWPKIKNYGDITKIKTEELPDFDLLTGGSPCQDLSIAGKRKGLAGERSGLFHHFIRILRAKRPKYFIWENVKGALSSNQGRDFERVLIEMAEAGYTLWWQVLNAKDFGVPQNRERIFIVGFRDRCPPEVFFEAGSGGKNLEEITRNVSDAQRIYDGEGLAKSQKALGGGQGAKTGLYLVPKIVQKSRGFNRGGYHNICPTISSNTFEHNNHICIPVITPDRIEKRQNGRRFKNNGEPMFTINCQDRHGIFDGFNIRKLTPTEGERLMGLPDGWTSRGSDNGKEFEVSDHQRFQMIGNGVVVPVVEWIIKEVINHGIIQTSDRRNRIP